MKKKKDYIEALGHLCLLVTIIMMIWIIVAPMIEKMGMITKVLFILITGIGGTMVYIPIGIKLVEIKNKYGKK
jgi:hypothetical protein